MPGEFLDRLEYVDWTGEYKDLSFITGSSRDEILLIDDDAGWIRPDQRDRWLAIAPWDGDDDRELLRIQAILEGFIDR